MLDQGNDSGRAVEAVAAGQPPDVGLAAPEGFECGIDVQFGVGDRSGLGCVGGTEVGCRDGDRTQAYLQRTILVENP